MKIDGNFGRESWLRWQVKWQSRFENVDESSLGSFLKKEFPRARIIPFVGMKRSGNHAIINWSIHNCFESTLYLNSINSSTNTPDSLVAYHSEHLIPREMDRIIITFENKLCQDLRDLDCNLIIRDPFNWLASWVSHFHFSKDNIDTDIEMYLKNIKDSKEKIFFNEWFSNQSYRDSLAYRLGFSNRDTGIDIVTKHGKGSSFDRKSYDGKAREMKVLDRWKNMLESQIYVEKILLFKDDFGNVCKDYFPNIDFKNIISTLENQ